MSFDQPQWIFVGFAASSLVILFAGVALAGTADRLADRTGMGEALVGGLLLGAATSLAGLVTSVNAAWDGFAELAISNAAGGIAGQTVFLVAADIAYRRGNLEHAAASLENLIQGTVLIAALSLCFFAIAYPEPAVFGVHPVSVVIALVYLLGLHTAHRARGDPGWRPKLTAETRQDEPEVDAHRHSLTRLLTLFVVLALVTAAAGYVLSRAAEGAIEVFGWSESVVGAFATALLTSLPELVTTLAAVRRGALTLAVGGIIGGNSFDTLFLAASDAAYREGSIYAAIGPSQTFVIALALFMAAILLMGLLRRQKEGPGRLGFETVLMLLAYLGGGAVLIGMG